MEEVEGGLGAVKRPAGVESRLQVKLVVVTLAGHELLDKGLSEIQRPVQGGGRVGRQLTEGEGQGGRDEKRGHKGRQV